MRVLTLLLSMTSAAAFSANHVTKSQPAQSLISHNAVSRRNFLAEATAAAATAAIAQPSAANAAEDKIPPYTGVYSDPNHKNGYRVVRAIDKSTASIILQDEPAGPIITVTGKVKTNKKSGTVITMDLSPKGGPKNIEAKVAKDKLFFPDGNAWTKFPGIDGVYSDPNHPKGYRVVRVSRSGRISVTLQDDTNGPVIELQGKRKSANGYLFIDFSPKGGPKNLAAVAQGNKLVFPDGNAWTKL